MAEEHEYKLRIDPRILELLGPNLYTNIYYVLAELIANAYDANAKNVYITADNHSIIVEDDGHGMSYMDGDVDNFLNVARETRTNNENSFVKGSNQTRKKMGRKGVGKLAALSVSKEVEIKTIKNNEKSGFILSRHVDEDKKLSPIPTDQINFLHVRDHGTSITMKNPQYKINKTLKSAKNNLLKIFPLVNEDFKIHLQIDTKKTIIESFEKEILDGLGALITLGEEFSHLHDHFNSQLKITPQQEDQLHIKRSAHPHRLTLTKKDNTESDYLLSIRGWIGAYRSSTGKKQHQTDFPENFISILSNKKMGEFNILPIVGKNALNEVYIVGQLHIDLFEESELPDMALSNRQGYKSDDIRYETVINYVRKQLLPEVISLRAKYASYRKSITEKNKNIKDIAREGILKKNIDTFKENAAHTAAKSISKSLNSEDHIEQIEQAVGLAINKTLPDMGIKSTIDDQKKKLLISHTSKNKTTSDFIFDLIEYAGVPTNAIIYTSNDDANTRIPESESIYDYLRKFFVNSYSTQKIYVIYITSDEMAASWACVSEVGAGWILQSEHNIFNINTHTPKQPLNINREWANLAYNSDDDEIVLSTRDADVISEKVRHICNTLGYQAQSKANIIQRINRKVTITD